MKRIKNLTLGVIGATILSLGLYACSNDDATTNNNTPTEQTTLSAKLISNSEIMNYDYEKIGIVHNQGLEYVYNRLAANAPLNDSYIMHQSQSFLIESIGKFLEVNGIGNNPDNISIIQKYTLTNNDFLSFDARKNYVPSLQEYKNSLSSDALNLTNEIENKVENFDFENSSIANFENELREKIADSNKLLETQKISQNEYITLRTSISIAIHSGQYWKANLNNWNNLVTTSDKQPSSWLGRWWRQTVKSDIAGGADGYKNGGGKVDDAKTAAIAASVSAGLQMIIDKIGGVDSTQPGS